MKEWKTISGTQIYRILGLRCNVFLVQKGEHALLFDSSIKSTANVLTKRLRGLGVNHMDAMIFSHTHFDHAGNAALIRREFQAPVYVHQTEALFLENGNTPLPAGATWLTARLMRFHQRYGIPEFAYEPCQVDHPVSGTYSFEELGFHASLIETPGHSVGSISLIIDDEIALVGDTICHHLPGMIFPPFADSPELVIRSWGKLLSTSCSLFFPAHGKPVTRALLEKWYQRKKG